MTYNIWLRVHVVVKSIKIQECGANINRVIKTIKTILNCKPSSIFDARASPGTRARTQRSHTIISIGPNATQREPQTMNIFPRLL